MAHSFSLSLAAVDILLDHAGLGRAPFPFEVPHIGTTHAQRAQVREAVFRELEGRGLMRGGRLDADTQLALETFVRSTVSIVAVAQLEDSDRLFARASLEGQYAVLAKQDGNLLVFEEIRPEAVVPAVVDLLPSKGAGPGQSVTVAKPAPEPRGRHRKPDGDSYDPFAGVSRPRSQSSAQLRAVERMFEKPKIRLGQFTTFVRGRDGKETVSEPVVWFDTEEGRFFSTTRVADDGQQWLTYAPADRARIAHHLRAQLESRP